jgi:LysM repeat protein
MAAFENQGKSIQDQLTAITAERLATLASDVEIENAKQELLYSDIKQRLEPLSSDDLIRFKDIAIAASSLYQEGGALIEEFNNTSAKSSDGVDVQEVYIQPLKEITLSLGSLRQEIDDRLAQAQAGTLSDTLPTQDLIVPITPEQAHQLGQIQAEIEVIQKSFYELYDTLSEQERDNLVREHYEQLQTAEELRRLIATLDTTDLTLQYPRSTIQLSLDEVQALYEKLVSGLEQLKEKIKSQESSSSIDSGASLIDNQTQAKTETAKAEAAEIPLAQSSVGTEPAGVGAAPEEATSANLAERERLIEYYERWQQRDESLFDKGWMHNLSNIHRDLGRMIYLAGYSSEESADIYKTQLKPWIDRVVGKRKNQLPDVSFKQLREEILSIVSKLLEGRVLLDERLEKSQTAPSDGDTESQSENAAESEAQVVERAEQEVSRFDSLKESLDVPTLLAYDYVIRETEGHVKYIKNIISDNQMNPAKRISQLKVRTEMLEATNQRLEEALTVKSSSAPEKLTGKEREAAALATLNDLNRTFKSLTPKKQAELSVEYDYALSLHAAFAFADAQGGEEADVEALYAMFTKKAEMILARATETTDPVVAANEPAIDPVPTPGTGGAAHPTPTAAPVPPSGPVPPGTTVPLPTTPDTVIVDRDPARALAWRESRKEFLALKREREGAFAAHYEAEAKSVMGKVRSFGKIFGLKPELPKELQALEVRYNAAKLNHAKILSMMDRVKERYDITATAAATDSLEEKRQKEAALEVGKRAFARHFVINERMRQMKLQEQVIAKVDSEAYVKAAIKNVMAGMSKYKWHTRAAIILGAGTLGALTGGAAVGGLAALASGSRMAASIGAGVWTGALVRTGMEFEVNKRKRDKRLQIASIEDGFSLESLEDLQNQMDRADEKYRRTIKQKDLLTVVAAGAAGLTAGMATSLAMADTLSGASGEGGTREDSVEVPSGEAAVSIKSVEVDVRKPGTLSMTQLTVSDISLRGTDVDTSDGIPKVQVERAMRLALEDVIADKPNITVRALEQEVFDRLEKKYGNTDWWKEAKITQLKIGAIEGLPQEGAASVGTTDAELPRVVVPEVPPSVSTTGASEVIAQPSSYPVAPGDTLWKIMKTEYADTLKGLTPDQQNRALDVLFDKARANAELRDSIGLNPKADGNIDKIWPGDKLNLKALGAELEKIANNPEELRPRTQSGVLSVNTDSEVQVVPIRFGQVPAQSEDFGFVPPTPTPDAYTGFGPDMSIPINEAATTESAGVRVPEGYYDVPKPPVLAGPSGNYLQDPSYIAYLNENGITEVMLQKGTEKFVQNFEGKTYSLGDELFRGYKSPFEQFADLTIREVNEMRAQFAAPATEGVGIFRGVNEAALREFAQMKGMKVETVLAWSRHFEDMATNPYLPFNDNTTVKDWVSRDVAQRMIQEQYDQKFTGKV